MTMLNGHVSLEMLDALGVTVSMPIYTKIDDTKTVATAMSDAGLLAEAVDDISDSQIKLVKLTITQAPPGGAKGAPVSTAENERTGLFNFSQATGPYKFGVDVPSLADSLIVNGKINLSDAEVAAFITIMTAAATALTPESTSLYTLVALLDALLTFRKHRKAESRRSLIIP